MSKSKVIFSGIVFLVVFGLTYYYQDLLGLKNPTIVDQAIIHGLNLQSCLVFAGLSALLVLVLLYTKKQLDPNELTKEYIRTCKFKDRDLEKFNTLDDKEQVGVYEYYQDHFSLEDTLDCLEFIDKKQPKTNKFIKYGLSGLILAAIALTLNPVYSDYVVAKEQYDEQVRLQEEEYNRIITDQYLSIEGLPTIQIIPGNQLKNGDVQKYLERFVKTQPQFLLNNCRQINLCEPKNFENIATADGVDLDNRGFGTYAYASSDNLSITLQVDVDEDWDQKGAVTHELTHIFDFIYGNNYDPYGISDGYVWQSLHQSNPSCLGAYGEDNTAEFFADAGEMYVNEPDELKKANMDIFNYMNSLYQMY